MFSERQVVILKEAQQMRDVEKLETYIEHPLNSTIFIVGHKEKKVDGRSKLAKQLKHHAVLISTKKLYDNELPFTSHSTMISKCFQVLIKDFIILENILFWNNKISTRRKSCIFWMWTIYKTKI